VDAPVRAQRTFQIALRVYAVLVALWVGIWLAAGAGYFWPVWPALGTGAVVG
jgi:hypothetical protein